MISNTNNRRDIKEVIKELTRLNNEIERLIGKLPTCDDKVLAALSSGFDRMTRLLNTETTAERGSLFYEQAVGRAMSLKDRYNNKLMNGGLRGRK